MIYTHVYIHTHHNTFLPRLYLTQNSTASAADQSKGCPCATAALSSAKGPTNNAMHCSNPMTAAESSSVSAT